MKTFIGIAVIAAIIVGILIALNTSGSESPDQSRYDCNKVLALSAYRGGEKYDYCKSYQVCREFYSGKALEFCIELEIILRQ